MIEGGVDQLRRPPGQPRLELHDAVFDLGFGGAQQDRDLLRGLTKTGKPPAAFVEGGDLNFPKYFPILVEPLQ